MGLTDLTELSDEALMQSYAEGDQTAFADLVRRYGDRLLRYLVRLCRNREEAEDLFQEAFRKVHENADRFQQRGSFKSWLYTIATNVALDGMRKKQRRPEMLSLNATTGKNAEQNTTLGEQVEDEKTRGPADSILLDEQKEQVRYAVEQLPEGQRVTLVLAYYQKLAYKEVAEIMNCSVGTVKSQMYRALRTLKTLLPEMG